MKKVIKIKGMMCAGCVRRVDGALTALGARADIDLANGTATVQSETEIPDADIRSSIEALGFDVISIA